MALNTVTVTWNEIDAAVAPLGGYVTFQLSADLADSSDGEIVRRNPAKVFNITAGGGQSSPLVANDNSNVVPSGSYYTVTVNITGQQVATFTTQINFVNGATQTLAYLQANAALPAAQYGQYLSLPPGTPQAGDIAVATGLGTAMVWMQLAADMEGGSSTTGELPVGNNDGGTALTGASPAGDFDGGNA